MTAVALKSGASLVTRTAKIGRASCRESVDLGGRRIIKKQKKKKEKQKTKQQSTESHQQSIADTES